MNHIHGFPKCGHGRGSRETAGAGAGQGKERLRGRWRVPSAVGPSVLFVWGIFAPLHSDSSNTGGVGGGVAPHSTLSFPYNLPVPLSFHHNDHSATGSLSATFHIV